MDALELALRCSSLLLRTMGNNAGTQSVSSTSSANDQTNAAQNEVS